MVTHSRARGIASKDVVGLVRVKVAFMAYISQPLVANPKACYGHIPR